MRKTLILVAALGVILGVAAYVEYGRKPRMSGPLPSPPFPSVENGTAATSDGDETATFGGGCFWCTEAVFQRMKGVKSVLPGYSGGQTKNPTYEEVCTGTTGHAEAIQIVFDPTQVSYGDLLQVFWATHDPTTLNRQGHDFGTQYRSVIFWHSERQKKLAEEYKQKIADAKVFDAPLVTEIAPFEQFYVAEDYHQNFFAKNPQQGYCQLTIPPKLAKLEKLFPTRLKGTQETAK